MFAQIPPPLHEALLRAYIAGAASRPLADCDRDALVAPWLGARGQPAFYRQIEQADQRYTDDGEPLYPSIQMPVLIVWGVEDAWIPVDRAHRLAEVIPGAELRLVPDAGHLIRSTRPSTLPPHSSDGCWAELPLGTDGFETANGGGRDAGAAGVGGG